jgi:hypothetical protein
MGSAWVPRDEGKDSAASTALEFLHDRYRETLCTWDWE